MQKRIISPAPALLIAVALPALVTHAQNQTARTFEAYLPHPSGITISDPIAGNVCIEDDKPTAVCGAAEFIDIVGENMCEWSENIDYPCTYYGYEFNYSGGEAGQLITCDTHRSTETIFGPRTEQVTGPMTARYTMELESDTGRIFRTPYNTYAPVGEPIYIREMHRCSYAGTLLYQVHWIVRFTPEN